MRYTATLIIDADSLTEAWDKLASAVPESFAPKELERLEDSGLLSFTLNGGGQEVHGQFHNKDKGSDTYVLGYPPFRRGTVI